MEDETKKNDREEVKTKSSETPKLDELNDKPNPANKTSYTYEIGETVKYIVPTKKKYKKKITIKNIAIASVIVNATLACLTWLLFKTASSQANSAISAANIANNTLKETKRYNDSSLTIQQKAFDSNNADSRSREKRENTRSKRDSVSLGAQLQTIRETKKEFEIENQPYLQINQLANIYFEDNDYTIFDYSIFNLGKQPVKEIDGLNAVVFVPKKDSLYFAKNGFKRIPKLQNISTYFTKEVPQVKHYRSVNKNLIGTVNAIKTEKYFAYFIGIIRYTNNSNNATRVYKYIIRLRYDKSMKLSYEFVFNENKDEKKGSVN